MITYLTAKQVRDLLQISRSTLYCWIQNNQIPYIRLPNNQVRFDEKELLDWMAHRRVSVHA